MSLENKINEQLQKHPRAKKIIKRSYQALMWTLSKKVKKDGCLIKVTPNDQFEYFYGYYDKSPWDSTDRFVLCIRVKQAYKSVAPAEPAMVCIIDTMTKTVIEIGITRTWNVQQGCMAQWLGPCFDSRIIYNDFRDGQYCSVVFNVKTMAEEKVLPLPIYDVSRDGRFALSLDFSRLNRLRPGYGYSNLPDKTKNELCPGSTCIWRVEINDGRVSELYSYKDFERFCHLNSMEKAQHKVNHLMISPDGKRFMVLHRWLVGGKKYSRLITSDCLGKDLYLLSDDEFVSHCCWKNNNEIVSYLEKEKEGRHYYLLNDKSQDYKMIWSELDSDGHPSFSPDGKSAITDTYPNRARMSSLYLIKNNSVELFARVFSPFRYDNDVRCDLHPRWDRKGEKICIDAAFEGKREMYVLPLKKKIIPLICIRKCVNKGPVQQTYNLIKNLDMQMFAPRLLTLNKEDPNDTIYGRFEELDFEKKTLECNYLVIAQTILGIGSLIKKVREIAPDIIHTTGIYVDFIGSIVARKLGIKHLATVRNYVYDDYLDKFGRTKGLILAHVHLLMMKKLSTSEFVCCSQSLAEKYRKIGVQMKYIRNGVDVERFNTNRIGSTKEIRKKMGLPENCIIIITVAQIIKRKNITETIDAIPEKLGNSSVLFVLVGDGPELSALKDKYGERQYIMFVGRQNNVEEWLRASDIFVSSSTSEGLPNSVIEAMAMGLPVILSDIEQHMEIFEINNNVGELYKLHDKQDLMEKIKLVASGDRTRYGENGKSVASKELSSHRMSEEYQAQYRGMI